MVESEQERRGRRGRRAAEKKEVTSSRLVVFCAAVQPRQQCLFYK